MYVPSVSINGYSYTITASQIVFSVLLKTREAKPILLCPPRKIAFQLFYCNLISDIMQVMNKPVDFFLT